MQRFVVLAERKNATALHAGEEDVLEHGREAGDRDVVQSAFRSGL